MACWLAILEKQVVPCYNLLWPRSSKMWVRFPPSPFDRKSYYCYNKIMENEIKRAFHLIDELTVLVENTDNPELNKMAPEVESVYRKIDELYVEVLKKS